MKKKYYKILVVMLLGLGGYHNGANGQQVDATTMNDKIMAGYQGWFRTPGDADGNRGWAHLFNGVVPSPAKLAFDTWPDMSELKKSEKYPVPGFSYADGSQAYLYSAQHYQTVLRHFKWMQQYGIDGVWLSEFCGHFPGGGAQADSTAVLNIMNNVRRAARSTGRTWAFMWDMSGLSTRLSRQKVFDIIVDQWKKMVDEGVTTDNRYLHDHGKPVLLIWGFFPNRAASQPDYMNPVIDFLRAPGKYQATLVGGADPNWRTQGTPGFQAMLMRLQGLQPWSVGRRVKDPATGYAVQNMSLWEGDIQKCKEHHVLFMPVFNSGTHIAGPPPAQGTPTVPRRTGNYLWEQFVMASKYGLKSAFIAMFDEINEGTQIMKIDLHPPVQAPFFTYDGATSDYYLRLVGTGAAMLRKGEQFPPYVPISPFDEHHDYLLKSAAGGQLLVVSGSRAPVSATKMPPGHWYIHFDQLGYFELEDAQTGKYLSNQQPRILVDKPAANAEANIKWHLEWDGSGYCRIIGKNSGQALAMDTAGQLSLSTDMPDDRFRWRILP